jgi:hypothetical protein
MGYDEAGLTKVTVLSSLNRELTPEERLRQAVQATVKGQFELHGELGRSEDGSVVYLASELASRRLVALRLARSDASGGDGEDWWLEVVRKLDASIPAIESSCPECGGALRGWARFCRHCGADLSGIAQGSGPNTSADDLLKEVRAAARGRYEILGQMDRAEGGGIVYFAKNIRSQKLVALRLTRQAASSGGTEVFQLGETRVLGNFKESLGVGDRGTEVSAPRPTLPPPTNSKEVAAIATTAPKPMPAAPAPAPVAPPAPAATPTAGRGPRPGVWIAGIAGVVLIAVLLVWRRSPTPAPVAVVTPPPVAAPDSGTLRVGVALPPGANLTIDGNAAAGERIRLAVGPHIVAVAAPGYAAVTQQIDVNANETAVWTPVFTVENKRPAVVAVPPALRAPKPSAQPPQPKVSTPPATTGDAGGTTPPPIESRPTRNTCQSLFAQQNWKDALTKCEEEQQAGSITAARSLGMIYENGFGVRASPQSAAKLYQRAADAGDAFAQFRLGMLMIDGIGVRRDDQRGNDWLKKAVEQDQPDAMYAYARQLERGRGTKKDMNGAIQMFQKCAELSNALCEHRLGLLYAEGKFVAKDDATAAQWYQKAATQGYPEAQYLLGQAYLVGRGVSKSDADARKWFTAAAAKGYRDAEAALKRMK